jgi:hypothetical protein
VIDDLAKLKWEHRTASSAREPMLVSHDVIGELLQAAYEVDEEAQLHLDDARKETGEMEDMVAEAQGDCDMLLRVLMLVKENPQHAEALLSPLPSNAEECHPGWEDEVRERLAELARTEGGSE